MVETSASDPLRGAFDAWLRSGKPLAWYVAHGDADVRAVRVLADEIAPESVEIARSFLVADRPPIRRVRLLRAVEPQRRVLGWGQFYLLAGESDLAGRILPVDVNLGDAHFDVPVSLTVPAFVLPIEERLEEWSDAQLTDFLVGLMARWRQDEEADRKSIAPIFHFEDELVSATVVAQKCGRYQLRLSFGLVVWPDLHTDYDFEARPVPPSLRPHLRGDVVVEPHTDYSSAEPLVALCRHLAEGRILEFSQPAWEGALAEHPPRRLVRMTLASGAIAFAVGIDCVDRMPLKEVVAKLQARATQV